MSLLLLAVALLAAPGAAARDDAELDPDPAEQGDDGAPGPAADDRATATDEDAPAAALDDDRPAATTDDDARDGEEADEGETRPVVPAPDADAPAPGRDAPPPAAAERTLLGLSPSLASAVLGAITAATSTAVITLAYCGCANLTSAAVTTSNPGALVVAACIMGAAPCFGPLSAALVTLASAGVFAWLSDDDATSSWLLLGSALGAGTALVSVLGFVVVGAAALLMALASQGVVLLSIPFFGTLNGLMLIALVGGGAATLFGLVTPFATYVGAMGARALATRVLPELPPPDDERPPTTDAESVRY